MVLSSCAGFGFVSNQSKFQRRLQSFQLCIKSQDSLYGVGMALQATEVLDGSACMGTFFVALTTFAEHVLLIRSMEASIQLWMFEHP